jgi:AcrR family transcriptional regulator
MPKVSAARERLVRAAFELFESQGYAETTVDDIAERAGVGRTTFFRLFGSKEDVIFPEHDQVLARVQARLEASTQQSAAVALADAAGVVLTHYLHEGELARARYRLTSTVPALRARELASAPRYQRLFRESAHAWMGGGDDTALDAELLAGAVVLAHNHVLRRWLRGQTDRPVAELDRAMSEVLARFATPVAAEGQSTVVVVVRTTEGADAVAAKVSAALG